MNTEGCKMATKKLFCIKLRPCIESSKMAWALVEKARLETLQSPLLFACSLQKQVKLSSSQEMACSSVVISLSILFPGVWKMPQINIGWANVSTTASNVGGDSNSGRLIVAIVAFRWFPFLHLEETALNVEAVNGVFCPVLVCEYLKENVSRSKNCHANCSVLWI